MVFLVIAIGTSSLTFNWVIEHNSEANVFPEFAGRVVYLSDILMFVGLILWAVGWYLSPTRTIRYGPKYVFLPLLFLAVMTALSIVWAEDSGQAGFAATRRVLLLGLYLALVNEAHRSLAPTAVVLFALGLLHTGVALAQIWGGSVTDLTRLGELAQGALGYEGVGESRAYGLGFNPNPVGMFLAVVSILAFSLFLLKEGGWWFRALTLACCAIMFLGVASTSSRSALLGWILGVSVVTLLGWYWNEPERRGLLLRVGVAVLLFFFASTIYFVSSNIEDGQFGVERITGVPDRLGFAQVTQGLRIRASDLALAFPIIREHPIWGDGAVNYPNALHNKLNPDSPGGIYTPPHNVPITLMAELGFAALIGWSFIVASPVIWVILNRKSKKYSLHSLVWLGPLIVIIFEGFWDFTPWSTQDGRVLMMGVLGLWAGATSPNHLSVRNSSVN